MNVRLASCLPLNFDTPRGSSTHRFHQCSSIPEAKSIIFRYLMISWYDTSTITYRCLSQYIYHISTFYLSLVHQLFLSRIYQCLNKTYLSHVHHIPITYLPYIYHMSLTYLSHIHHIPIRYLPYIYHIIPYIYRISIIYLPYTYDIFYRFLPYKTPMFHSHVCRRPFSSAEAAAPSGHWGLLASGAATAGDGRQGRGESLGVGGGSQQGDGDGGRRG